MDKEFYNLAVKLMDNIRQLEPNLVSARDAELCVLMTESQQIYAGITSVKISAGQLMRACPEYNAIMAMVPEGESRVLKLITVSFSHREVSQPCEGCLELLCRVNKENVDTEIYIAANRSVAASELMPELVADAPEVAVPVSEEAEAPAEVEAAAETPAEVEAAAETPAEGEAAAETPAEGEAAAEAPAEGEAAAEAPAEGEAAAEAPAEGEAAAEAPAEDDKPKDDFAQFGFEEAEGDFATHVEIDKDNPFAAESGAVEAPKVMTPPPTMFDKPQSGYLDNPEAQSGYQQQSSEMSTGSMYASQPLPGQQQNGGVFQPMQQQPFQPMQQQPFQPMQQQPFQPMQQQPYQQQDVYQQQGGFPQQQYPQQGGFPQQQYPQQGGFPQQQVYQQQGGFPQQQVYQQQGGFPQQQVYQQQSTQFQPNPQQTSSHYSHNTSQYQQSSQFQPNPAGGAQYASQPLPGSTYMSQTAGGAMTASQPLPGSGTSVQQPAQKEAGSAFKERLNAYVDEDEKPKEKPLSKAEMMRQAKEKKKMAKIDADFKKQMKKKGL